MIESIKAASSATIGLTGLDASLIGIVFISLIALIVLAMLVITLALWSSYNELARECAYLQKENFKLIQQNMSKKVFDTTIQKR